MSRLSDVPFGPAHPRRRAERRGVQQPTTPGRVLTSWNDGTRELVRSAPDGGAKAGMAGGPGRAKRRTSPRAAT